MIELLKSNILQEATNLITSHNNKDKSSKENGISFVDMLIGKESGIKNNDEQKNDSYQIDINIEEKKINNDNTEDKHKTDEASRIKNNNENKEKIIDAKLEITNKKNPVINNKIDNVKSDSKTKVVRFNHSNKNEKDSFNIKVNYNNVEYKVELDFNSKEKIKTILRELKLGNIDETVANSLINQIINNSNIKNLAKEFNLKDKEIKVELKKIKSEDKQKSEKKKSNEFASDLNQSNNNLKIAVNEQGKNSSTNDKLHNKNSLKTENKTKETKSNNEEINIKGPKNEISPDKIDNKLFSIELNKGYLAETKKVLEENKDTLFSQIAKNTKISLSENLTKFSTMIRPEEFGRVDFNFIVKDGKMNGKIILQNQEVVDFFKSNVEELRAVFQKSNVELGNLDIILAGNRFGDAGGNLNNNSSNNSSGDEDKSLRIGNNVFSKKNINEFEEVNGLSFNNSKPDNSRVNILV